MADLDRLFNSTGRPGLWLDYVNYAAALLANGQAPWLDEGECIAWLRKAQGLLKSDVVSLPLQALCSEWLQAHPGLREAMGARTRSTYALKTLLADDAFRQYCVDLARSLRSSFADTPLVLICPSPARWMALARQWALDETIEVSDDDADAASVYVADFLRAFGDIGLDALLLEEEGPSRLHRYRPVVNVADHYRWRLGLKSQESGNGDADSLGFVIAPQPLSGVPSGCILSPGFWQGEAAGDCPDPGFRFAEIPADAAPEAVLQRLESLQA